MSVLSSNKRGLFLAEVLLSFTLVSVLMVSAFSILRLLKERDLKREKELRAWYVGRSKLEELLAKNFEALNASYEGCESISNYVGETGYLNGNVCVSINTISNWDADPDVDGKEIVVTVNFI